MVVPIDARKGGHRARPIKVDLLPDVPDIVKQELVEEAAQDAVAEPASIGKKVVKRSSAGEVRRFECLKRLKM